MTFDQHLPGRFHRHPTAGKRGCSAIPRDEAVEIPGRQDAEEVARRYRAGYRDTDHLGNELAGWAAEGA